MQRINRWVRSEVCGGRIIGAFRQLAREHQSYHDDGRSSRGGLRAVQTDLQRSQRRMSNNRCVIVVRRRSFACPTRAAARAARVQQ